MLVLFTAGSKYLRQHLALRRCLINMGWVNERLRICIELMYMEGLTVCKALVLRTWRLG